VLSMMIVSMIDVEPKWNRRPQATDDDVAAAALAGDAEALEEMLVRSEVPLRTALAGEIPAAFRSAFDVDDVIQVTFIEAFLRIRQFTPRGPGSFTAWLTRLARNNLRDAIKWLRRDKRLPRERQVTHRASHDSHVGLLETLQLSSTTPSRVCAREESKCLLETALSGLPPDYENVVRLMDLDRQTAPQAAKAMGRSVGAVYMLRTRAHALLLEFLGNSGKFFSSGT